MAAFEGANTVYLLTVLKNKVDIQRSHTCSQVGNDIIGVVRLCSREWIHFKGRLPFPTSSGSFLNKVWSGPFSEGTYYAEKQTKCQQKSHSCKKWQKIYDINPVPLRKHYIEASGRARGRGMRLDWLAPPTSDHETPGSNPTWG